MTDPQFYSLCLGLIATAVLAVRLWPKKKPVKPKATRRSKDDKWLRNHPRYDKDYFDEGVW